VTDVLYLLGKGRSGSTLLAMALGELDGFFAVGELRFFWRRGLIEERHCACGQPVPQCEVWGEVASRVADIDPHQAAADAEAVFRWRASPRLLAGPTRSWAPLQRWASATTRLVAAVAEATGASVVVDSSKWPTDPGMLGHVADIRSFPVLLVRDPRAVAWSWQRTKAHHDLDHPRDMDRYPATHSALSWTARTLVAGLAVRRSGRPHTVVRYEDFTVDPKATLNRVAAFVGRTADVGAAIDGRTLHLTASHTVAGNPTRFADGEITIRPDEEWAERLPGRDRRLVSALTWPLRHRYGY
jgi:Sulfotransferase family